MVDGTNSLYSISSKDVPIGARVIDKDENLFIVHSEGETHFGCKHCCLDGFTCLDNPCGTTERTDGKGIYYQPTLQGRG